MNPTVTTSHLDRSTCITMEGTKDKMCCTLTPPKLTTSNPVMNTTIVKIKTRKTTDKKASTRRERAETTTAPKTTDTGSEGNHDY